MNKRGFFLIIALVFTINFIDFVQADVVIIEIMYNQPGQEEDLEYIELYNSGDTDVDVSGWTLSNAVYLLNWLYQGGPAPTEGDVSC